MGKHSEWVFTHRRRFGVAAVGTIAAGAVALGLGMAGAASAATPNAKVIGQAVSYSEAEATVLARADAYDNCDEAGGSATFEYYPIVQYNGQDMYISTVSVNCNIP